MLFDRQSVTDQPAAALIIGHRGAAGLRPENTLSSFSHALELQVDAVELDIHTLDGELVVIHDDMLERTTNGTGSVAACSLAELRALDAGSGDRVPLLREVFELMPPSVGINVELKGAGTAPGLAHFLQDYPDHRVLVSSFDHQQLRTFHVASPEVPVAPLLHRWKALAWETARTLGAWSINLSVRIATRQRIAEAHERGLRVLVYTVNEPETARALGNWGIDGLFTDYPDRITRACLGDSTPG